MNSINTTVSSITKTNTGNPEWRTPDAIINAVRSTMGSIDCDPATFPDAQKFVQAKVHYTKLTNGLDKDWIGNVYLNPPYYNTSKKAGPGIDAFTTKLLSELRSGNAKQAIFLAQSKTDTRWFQKLYAHADAVLFTDKRIKFIDRSGEEGGNPGYGSVIFYFGINANKFVYEFDDIAYQAKG